MGTHEDVCLEQHMTGGTAVCLEQHMTGGTADVTVTLATNSNFNLKLDSWPQITSSKALKHAPYSGSLDAAGVRKEG
jgi:hypothetical protein